MTSSFCTIFVACGLTSLVAGETRAADPPLWLRDLDAAKSDAKAPSKDLFLLFTGIGWCKPCMDFDRKVLTQTTFLDGVRKDYVLVELDHTFGETPAEKDRQARFEALEKRYLIHGFPTVVLADSGGMPYAVMTGYESEVPATLAWIAKARAARERRDGEFRAASGVERAKRLHQGIQAVSGLLGTLEERGDDPVLVYLKDQVAEIDRLDPGGEFGKVYDTRRAERDRWTARQAVFRRLDDLGAAKDFSGAIKLIDETVKSTTDRQFRLLLERTRTSFLDREHKEDEALLHIRRILSQSDLTADERYHWMFDEARYLFRLGRVEEGVAVWDRCIAAADTPEKRVRRLDWKAQMIPLKTHRELKMAAWRACRGEAPRGSDKWLLATYFLAEDARKAGKPREALVLFHEELDFDHSDWTMTQIVECHLDLGESEKAREWLDKAEIEAARSKSSPREGDKQAAIRVETRVKELRARLKSEKGPN
jgi:thioredoxin-related protein